ncbi:cytochrome P450 protein [Rutstroemia sp. NJR-2017a WRK4]|nr:cytochrome P450 protein [Rutstroemia sp. NJR-2017a WRK4]
MKQLAFTSPILGHLQVPPERKGPKSEAFRIMIGVLKNKLRSNVPAMSKNFQHRIKEAIDLEVAPLTDKKFKTDEREWRKVRLMPALLRIFTRVNLLVFIGEEQGTYLVTSPSYEARIDIVYYAIANRPEVYQDVMDFFWSCAKAFPILGIMPDFLLPLLLRLTRQSLDGEDTCEEKHVSAHLLSETARSLKISCRQHEAQGNITQWTSEMARIKDAIAVAKITLGLLFASAFQVPMVAQFCIHSICKHPEYYEKLRAEAVEYQDVSFGAANQEMPYLDSFIKETARLTPGIILSAPRTVMVPYTSPEGYHIPTGNWLAIPQVSVMRDESIWPRATTFEGFRFVNDNGTSKSRLTHPSYDFPFWGSIRHAW